MYCIVGLYLCAFIDFLWGFSVILTDFFATRIRTIDTDPDPGVQNDADPTESGSTSLFNPFSSWCNKIL